MGVILKTMTSKEYQTIFIAREISRPIEYKERTQTINPLSIRSAKQRFKSK